MGAKKKTPPAAAKETPGAGAPSGATSPADRLTPAVLARLEALHEQAELELVQGPAGGGWRYNEAKLAAAEEWAAFLRVLRGPGKR